MQNFDTKLAKAEKTLKNIRGIFENNDIVKRLEEIEKISQDINFWKNKEKAKKIVKEKKF